MKTLTTLKPEDPYRIFQGERMKLGIIGLGKMGANLSELRDWVADSGEGR